MYWFRCLYRDLTAGQDLSVPPGSVDGVGPVRMGRQLKDFRYLVDIVRNGVLAVLCSAFLLGSLAGPAAAQTCGTPPCGAGGAGGGKPLSASLVQGLNFGNVGNDPSLPGTATVDPLTGTKTVTGGATDMGGTHAPAIFDIRGEKLRTFTITLPVQITIAGPGGSTTTIDNVISSPALVGVLDSTGKATVAIGGTLQLSGPLSIGAYTNLFDITVTYQ